MGKARAQRPQASARPSSTAAPHAPQPVPLSSAQAAPPSSAHGSGPVRPALRLRQPQLRRPARPPRPRGQSPRTARPYHKMLRSPQLRPYHLPPLTGAGPSGLPSGCVSPNYGAPPAHPDHVPGQSPRTARPYHQMLRSGQWGSLSLQHTFRWCAPNCCSGHALR